MIKARIGFRASDRSLQSEEVSLTIQAVASYPPQLAKKNSLTVEHGEITHLDTNVIDFVPRLNESDIRINILKGI